MRDILVSKRSKIWGCRSDFLLITEIELSRHTTIPPFSRPTTNKAKSVAPSLMTLLHTTATDKTETIHNTITLTKKVSPNT